MYSWVTVYYLEGKWVGGNYSYVIKDYFFFFWDTLPRWRASILWRWNMPQKGLHFHKYGKPWVPRVANIKTLCVILKPRKRWKLSEFTNSKLFNTCTFQSNIIIIIFPCAETYLYNILKLRNVEILSQFTLVYNIKKYEISFTGMTSSLAEPYWQSWSTIFICSERTSRGAIKKNTPKDLEIGVLSL